MTPDGGGLTDAPKSIYQTNPPLMVGNLVEYKHPLPENRHHIGIVVKIREIASNVYERGYLEADVRWSTQRQHSKFNDRADRSVFETHEDASLLKILS